MMVDPEPLFRPLDRQHLALLVRFSNAEAKRANDLEKHKHQIGTLTRIDAEPQQQRQSWRQWSESDLNPYRFGSGSIWKDLGL